MKTILITLMLMVSQAAFCQQMYDRSGSLIGRYESGRIYDRSGSYEGKVESGRFYTRSGSYLGYVRDNRYYDHCGSYIGYCSSNYYYDRSGSYLGYISSSGSIYTSSGSLIGSTRNVPDHIVALVYFYGIFPLR